LKAYKVAEFTSGSPGLDRLVSKVQKMPKNSITNPMTMGGAPQAETADRCIEAIARITALADHSPGGSFKPQALEICWEVYGWIQGWSTENQVVSKNYHGPDMVSYQTLEDIDKI
jgi:hypothetical protein